MNILQQTILFLFTGLAMAAGANPDLSVSVSVSPSRNWVCHDEPLPLVATLTPDASGTFEWSIDGSSPPVSISPLTSNTTTVTMNAGSTTATSVTVKVKWTPSDGGQFKEKSISIAIKTWARPGVLSLVGEPLVGQSSSVSPQLSPGGTMALGIKYPADQDDICLAHWDIKYSSEINASAYASASAPWYSSSNAAASAAANASYNNATLTAKAGATTSRTWLEVMTVDISPISIPIVVPLTQGASASDEPLAETKFYENGGLHVKKSALQETRTASCSTGGDKLVEEGAYAFYSGFAMCHTDQRSPSEILKWKAGY